MTTHDLKTWWPFYVAIEDGRKNFDVRYNDRDFREGGILRLHRVPLHVSPFEANEPDGTTCEREVTYVLPGGQFGVQKGYVVLGLRERVTV